MGTIECMIKKKVPVDRVLTREEKDEILKENKDINISYLSLIKECLSYKPVTLRTLLNGWGGVKLIKVEPTLAVVKRNINNLEKSIEELESLISKEHFRGYCDDIKSALVCWNDIKDGEICP